MRIAIALPWAVHYFSSFSRGLLAVVSTILVSYKNLYLQVSWCWLLKRKLFLTTFFSSFPDLRLRILEVSKKEACFIYQVMPLSVSVKAIILKLWIIMSFILTGKLNPKGDVIVRSKSGRKRPSDLGLRLAQEWKNQKQLPELIYKRWGRKDCPETATLVYHGKEKIRLSTNNLAWVIAQVNFFRVNICLQNWAA